jgi:zinc ribbon protein
VFCPNCGTQNDSTATPCKKCGFKLSGVSVPKFKGTMMLNSEQTVQDMIESHRRKQAEGVAAERPKSRASEPPSSRNAPSNPPPPGSVTAPRGPVLQPPRAAAAPRRRMGGTMLGVAPQGGAVAPLAPELTATPPPVRTTVTSPAALDAPAGAGQAPDAYAGASEMPRAERTPVQVPVGSAPDPSSAIGPGHTRPFAMSDVTAGPGHTRPLSIGEVTSGAGHTRPLTALEAEEIRLEPSAAPPPLTPTSALTAMAGASLPAEKVAAEALPAEELAAQSHGVPPRLRALDVVLIVCTLGLYGLVLWARQRRLTRT